MKRVRYGLALAAMVASTVLVGLGATDASAGTLAASGWWWRAQGGTGLAPGAAPPLPGSPAPIPVAPPPPTVPEGGLMVSGTPEGATAIAALRFELEGDETMPVLELAIERATGAETAVLAACVTGSAWQPVAAGAWADKPFAACNEGSVNGVLSDDATSMSFALGPLLSDGLLDVVLVPGTLPDAPDGADGSPFEIVFQAPTSGSLQTSSGTPPETTSFDVPTIGGGGGGSGGGEATPTAGGAGFEAPGAPSDSFSSGGDTGSSAGFATPTTPDAGGSGFTAALEPEEQGLTFTAPAVEQASRPIAETSDDGPDARLLAGFVLALGAAALVWSSQATLPAPGSLLARFGGGVSGTTGPALATARAATLTSDAAPAPGGIGRFARTRTGAPPPL